MDVDAVRGQLGAEQDRLQALRDEFIEGGLTSQSEEDSLAELSSSAQHQADIGTETFDRERDVSILEQVEAELADVELALRRLDDGTYGTCEACGSLIGDARLEAKPEARLCLDDQARAEREVRGPSGSS
jgi:DnaK suppressor protein